MVVMEMSLAFFSILFNLVVLISIRERLRDIHHLLGCVNDSFNFPSPRESLLNSTVNVVLANLCAANLVSAVFVKSIAVVYNGYAVARYELILKCSPEPDFNSSTIVKTFWAALVICE